MRSRLAASCALTMVTASAAAAEAAAAARAPVTFPAGGDADDKAAAFRSHAHPRKLEEDLEECAAEASTCLGDIECLECMTSYVDHPVDYVACLEDYAPSSSSGMSCDAEAARPCCANLMSRGNCLESGSFLEYWGCNLREFHGCVDYEMTCDGVNIEVESSGSSDTSSSSNPRDTSSASSSPVVADDVAEEEEVVASEGSASVAAAIPLGRMAVATMVVMAGIAASAAGADFVLLLE